MKRAKAKCRSPAKARVRYDLVMGAINESVYDWDIANDRFITSGTMQRLLGVPRDRLTLAGWQKSIHPEDFPRFREATIAHLKGATERFECDYRFRARDGTWRWARTHGLAMRDRKGRAIRMVGSTGDITELKSAEMELRRARDEAQEALEQQTATADILKVIASSPSDVQPVFEAIARSGVRLFDGAAVAVALPDGDQVRVAAIAEADPARAEAWKQRFPFPLTREYLHGAAILDCRVVDVPDAKLASREWGPGLKNFLASGYRAATMVPMVRGGAAIGAISVLRMRPGALPPNKMVLLRTFADQAVIAIENVRLFNETREALDRQTATAEILKVIAGSPSDVQPVFEAIIKAANRLVGGCSVNVSRLVGDELHLAAYTPVSPQADALLRSLYPMPITEARSIADAVLQKKSFYVSDFESDPGVSRKSRDLMRARGFRSTLYVPILHGETVHGVLHVSKVPPGAFPQEWVDLFKTFADQAVIAIENVRLFNETKEALEHQRAAGEVLEAISGSITDAQPVFDKILDSCERLFEGRIVGLNVARDDGKLHIGAYHGERREEFEKIFPIPLDGDSGSVLAVRERRVVHYPDADATEVPARTRQGCRTIGIRSVIFAPVLWEGRALGSIFVGRDHVSTFSEKEIALLRTFADQAAIAIENVRLFNETKEALDQQTAISEILRVISQSPADVQPVFETIIHRAARLCNGTIAAIFRYDGELIHFVAGHNFEARMEAIRSKYPSKVDNSLVSGRVIQTLSVVHVEDASADPGYDSQHARLGGWRRMIGVPMLKDGKPLGVIVLAWDEAGLTPRSQEDLLRTFADQAVIAIENVRLFKEIQDKSRQLEVASRHKSEFLANMSHELRTPLNAIIGFTRIVMRRSREALEPKQYENLEKIHASGQHLLALINAVLDLSKIEAGRTEVVPAETPLAPVLEQCLRTVEPLVKVPLVREFNGSLPQMYVDEEKLRQIVINLLSNAAKFTEEGAIRVQARAADGSVDIAVADTGVGIPADKLGVIFEEFEQADRSSTRVHGGTGLGLAIARRLARLMGGDIRVDSALGRGSTFTLTLPLRYRA